MLLAEASVLLTVLALFLISVSGMAALRGIMGDWQENVKEFAVTNLQTIAQEESKNHAGAAEQSDDITMLTLKVRGA